MTIKEYMTKYNAGYKKRHRPTTTEMFKEGRFTFIDLKVEPTVDNFKGTIEPVVCSHFGCSVHLTEEQQLYGKYCIHHQNKDKIDPTVFISHPIKKTA